MGQRCFDPFEGTAPLGAAELELGLEELPLVGKLSLTHLERRGMNGPRRRGLPAPVDARGVEGIAATLRLGIDLLEIASHGGGWRGTCPKALELRVGAVAAGAPCEHRLREKRLAPECNEAPRIQVAGMEAPESHRSSIAVGREAGNAGEVGGSQQKRGARLGNWRYTYSAMLVERLPRAPVLLLLFLAAGRVAAAPPSLVPQHTETSTAALWQRGVALTARSSRYFPGSIHTILVLRDGQGGEKSRRESWSRIEVGPAGSPKTVVVRAVKNGRENTEAAQRMVDRHPERTRFDYSLLPTFPANQGRVVVKPSGVVRRIEDTPCVAFSFELQPHSGRRLTGTVWLTEKLGAPRLLTFSMEPLPPGVRGLRTSVRFAATPEGLFRAVSLQSEGSGGFLFFQRSFHLQMRFSDYFRPPVTDPSPSQ